MSLQETLSPSTAICLHNLYFSSVSLRQRGVITPCDKRARLLLTPPRPRGHQQFMTLITPVKWRSTVHARFPSSLIRRTDDDWPWAVFQVEPLVTPLISWLSWAWLRSRQVIITNLTKMFWSKKKNDPKLRSDNQPLVQSSCKIPQMVLKSRIPTFKLQPKRYLLVVRSSLHVVLFVLVLALSPPLRLPYSAHLFCVSHCPAHAAPRVDRSWVTTSESGCHYANIALLIIINTKKIKTSTCTRVPPHACKHHGLCLENVLKRGTPKQ